MSRLLGPAIHQAFVYPDFDAALARFAAGGIGPFFVLKSPDGIGRYRGEVHPLNISVAFVYSGEALFEIITPHGPQQSAYAEYLQRNPAGGLHHIAYHAEDFDATLCRMAEAGQPMRVVQEFFDPGNGQTFEIYCEPVGVDNPVLFQLLRPGVFDAWFDAMRRATAQWDGGEPIRDGGALMATAMAASAGDALE